MKKILILLWLVALGSSYIAQVKLLEDYLEKEKTPIIQVQTQEPQKQMEKEDRQDKEIQQMNLPGYPPPPQEPVYPYPPPRDYSHETPVPSLPTPAPTMIVEYDDN